MDHDGEDFDPFRVAKLILELRQSGITELGLLKAFETIKREHFVPADFIEHAYSDVALPIACGQTTSRPITIAGMINALELGTARHKTVLEIGTGSGFTAALMSSLARRVYTIDRYKTLVDDARKRFETLQLVNIISRCSDGLAGWPESAPFDRIISTCALEVRPDAWLAQLKPDGIMVIPVGTNEDQHVIQFRKMSDGQVQQTTLAGSKFLHLVEGTAKHL